MANPDHRHYESHCIRCGFCCEPFFMDDELIDQFKGYFSHQIINEVHDRELELTELQTADNKCVFLFPDNTCAIYEYRPEMCRRFGDPDFCECPRVTPDGKLRSESEFKRINDFNSDGEKWSDKHKKQLLEIGFKRVEYIKNKRQKK